VGWAIQPATTGSRDSRWTATKPKGLFSSTSRRRSCSIGMDVALMPIAVTAAASNPVAKNRASTVCLACPTISGSGLIALKCPLFPGSELTVANPNKSRCASRTCSTDAERWQRQLEIRHARRGGGDADRRRHLLLGLTSPDQLRPGTTRSRPRRSGDEPSQYLGLPRLRSAYSEQYVDISVALHSDDAQRARGWIVAQPKPA
jgi:hypothetical protein